jgi:hypothetical protein
MIRVLLVSAAFVIASLACGESARAQSAEPGDETPSCTEGRVRVGEGRCCWPSQRWSDDSGRCVGLGRLRRPVLS